MNRVWQHLRSLRAPTATVRVVYVYTYLCVNMYLYIYVNIFLYTHSFTYMKRRSRVATPAEPAHTATVRMSMYMQKYVKYTYKHI